MTTPRFSLPELVVAQSNKEITHNEALAIIDVCMGGIFDSVNTTPPASPTNGQVTLVAHSATTGVFVGHEDKLAYWRTSVNAWQYVTPIVGVEFRDISSDAVWRWSGTAWQAATPQLLNANLTALSGLTGAADKLAYFTGVGALALTTLTSLARTIIGRSAASDIRSDLSLVPGTDVAPLSGGLIPLSYLPTSAVPTMKTVANQTARYALTTTDVQNGDSVKQTDTGVMYYVVDDTNLSNSAGYSVYTAWADWSTITNIPANLTAEAGLTGAADTGSYYTGAGTKSTYSLTSFGRTLAALANYAALKTGLAYTASDVGADASGSAATAQSNAYSYADAKVQNSLTASTTVAPSASSVNTGLAAKMDASVLDTDATLSANSDSKIASQKATKAYIDAVVTGLSPKTSVKLATAAALAANTYANGTSGVGATLTGTATGVLTVDSVTVALNDRILVKNEATGANNGIYLCTTAGAVGVAYILTRTTDSDTSAEMLGAFVFVEAGTANSSAGYVCANSSAITMGSTSISFTQFSGAGEITAGNGITKSGNTLTLDFSASTAKTTPVDADGVALADSAASGATKFLSMANLWAWIKTKINAWDQTYTSTTLSSSSGVLTIDLSSAYKLFVVTLTENITSVVYSNRPASGSFVEKYITIVQASGTAYTCVTLATTGGTAGGVSWAASTVLASRERLVIHADDTTTTLFPTGVQV